MNNKTFHKKYKKSITNTVIEFEGVKRKAVSKSKGIVFLLTENQMMP